MPLNQNGVDVAESLDYAVDDDDGIVAAVIAVDDVLGYDDE